MAYYSRYPPTPITFDVPEGFDTPSECCPHRCGPCVWNEFPTSWLVKLSGLPWHSGDLEFVIDTLNGNAWRYFEASTAGEIMWDTAQAPPPEGPFWACKDYGGAGCGYTQFAATEFGTGIELDSTCDVLHWFDLIVGGERVGIWQYTGTRTLYAYCRLIFYYPHCPEDPDFAGHRQNVHVKVILTIQAAPSFIAVANEASPLACGTPGGGPACCPIRGTVNIECTYTETTSDGAGYYVGQTDSGTMCNDYTDLHAEDFCGSEWGYNDRFYNFQTICEFAKTLTGPIGSCLNIDEEIPYSYAAHSDPKHMCQPALNDDFSSVTCQVTAVP